MQTLFVSYELFVHSYYSDVRTHSKMQYCTDMRTLYTYHVYVCIYLIWFDIMVRTRSQGGNVHTSIDTRWRKPLTRQTGFSDN